MKQKKPKQETLQETAQKRRGVVVEEAQEPDWPLVGMTVEEAAKALRVSARTVQDMLAAGRLPGRLIGNKWRISPKALNSFLDSYEHDERED